MVWGASTGENHADEGPVVTIATAVAPSASATHFRGIDALRGVAALTVALAHLVQTGFPRAFAAHAQAWTTLGGFGVSFFFVISGFCIHAGTLRREAVGARLIEPRTFFTRRFVRLYPAHLGVLLMSVGLAMFVPIPTDASTLLSVTTPSQFTAHLFMAHTFWRDAYYSGNSVLWTLALETHFYLAYPVLLLMRSRVGTSWTVVGLLALSVSIAALARFAPGMSGTVATSALPRWWEWGLGCLTAEYVTRHPRVFAGWRRAGAIVAPGALLLAGILIVHAPGGGILRGFLWPAGFAVAIVEACRVPVDSRTPWVRALLVCGIASYSLYLVHPVAYHVALAALDGRGGVPLRCLVLPLAVALMTWGYHYLVERPTMRAATRIR